MDVDQDVWNHDAVEDLVKTVEEEKYARQQRSMESSCMARIWRLLSGLEFPACCASRIDALS
jgi:hypothetical protein